MKKLILIQILLISLISPFSFAAIINIPNDYPAIQQGIDASANGDTVLVHPGTYVENVNFNGHKVILASLYLTSEDTTYIAETVIDGDSSGSVVTFGNGENSTAMLIGFTVTNGFNGSGGGILIFNNSNPVIRHNSITGNTAHRGGGDTGSGGGISCGSSSPLIENNRITQSVAEGFDGNGGGISCDYGSPYISANLIADNFSNGMLGSGVGGGISSYYSEATIYDNVIIGNNASWNGIGGGICCIGPRPQIINNTISQNTSSWFGGGICLLDCQAEINGNIIYGNMADEHGAGIDCFNSNPVLTNNTITGNIAGEDGGGICSENNGSPYLFNTILWNNEPGEIFLNESGTIELSYCDIQGGWSGEGNIDCDPQFCAPVHDDYHLRAGSCCLGAGQDGADIGALGPGCYFPCGDYIVGDFNGSGQFNVADIISSYSRLAYGSPDPGMTCECPPGSGNFWAVAMDVNGSCSFNIADIVLAYQRLALGQPELIPCAQCPPGQGR